MKKVLKYEDLTEADHRILFLEGIHKILFRKILRNKIFIIYGVNHSLTRRIESLVESLV